MGQSQYNGLSAKGYQHNKRTISGTDKQVHELLPHVHLIVTLVKRWLTGTHQGGVAHEHLQSYLDEFVFRFNRRTSQSRGLLFRRLIENSMNTPPFTYDAIIKHVRKHQR